MSGNTKELKTYTIESKILEKGEFKDSKGRIVKVTDELMHDIYDSISNAAPCPMKDSHDLSNNIGDIKKYELRSDGIYQKTLITDSARFESRYSDGHCYVSPELEFEYDSNDNAKSGRLLGAALTSNPGMISAMPTIKQHHFEGPTTTDSGTPATPSWQEPLGELKTTINSLNSTLSTFGEQVKNMSGNTPPTTTQTQSATPPVNSPTATPNTVTMGVDDLAKLVNDAVEKRLNSAPTTAPLTSPEASEAAVPKVSPPADDIAQKYADMMNELNNLKGSQEKVYKKQLNAVVSDLKTMGMEHPEKMIPEGLTTEQQITILESIKENFAKNSPMSAPLQEPLANVSNANAKKGLSIDDVMNELEAGNDPAMRHKLMMLADSDLMAKYNMNTLYNSDGTYIGPV